MILECVDLVERVACHLDNRSFVTLAACIGSVSDTRHPHLGLDTNAMKAVYRTVFVPGFKRRRYEYEYKVAACERGRRYDRMIHIYDRCKNVFERYLAGENEDVVTASYPNPNPNEAGIDIAVPLLFLESSGLNDDIREWFELVQPNEDVIYDPVLQEAKPVIEKVRSVSLDFMKIPAERDALTNPPYKSYSTPMRVFVPPRTDVLIV